MHDDGDLQERRPGRRALRLWLFCTALLLVPALLVWAVRGAAYAFHCAPGPQVCNNTPLIGQALYQTLNAAWILPTNSLLLLILAFVAAIAAVFARRFLLGALTLIVVPILSLMLPMLAVMFSSYDGCSVNEGGIGDCLLWGTNMGMAFHRAANAGDLIYGFAPYTFSAALMLGLLGWFFTRPREPRASMAASMRMPERRPPNGGRLDQDQ
jgi:hypothetical protein